MVSYILICHKGSSLEIKRKRKDLKRQDSLEVLNLNNDSTNFQNVEKVIFFFHFLKKKFQLS